MTLSLRKVPEQVADAQKSQNPISTYKDMATQSAIRTFGFCLKVKLKYEDKSFSLG